MPPTKINGAPAATVAIRQKYGDVVIPGSERNSAVSVPFAVNAGAAAINSISVGELASHSVSTIAGTGAQGYKGDGGPASSATAAGSFGSPKCRS